LRLMGADPIRIKQLAFGLALATAAVAGALLIVIGPVEPSMNRQYIGRVFAIVVLGGMGSIGGTLLAALILGVAESFVATSCGPSWAPAVAFGLLLITLARRPQGIFGRYCPCGPTPCLPRARRARRIHHRHGRTWSSGDQG